VADCLACSLSASVSSPKTTLSVVIPEWLTELTSLTHGGGTSGTWIISYALVDECQIELTLSDFSGWPEAWRRVRDSLLLTVRISVKYLFRRQSTHEPFFASSSILAPPSTTGSMCSLILSILSSSTSTPDPPFRGGANDKASVSS
jgi:hypothetical protein